ncbi:MAG TPA: type II toxin-antitoxin system VapC family toxin [Pseudonocardiaceae bacterium]|nr:type II toxin-antitoxin system VapC family toxin [Pseudonocardiaceae bacterium]
MAPSVILDTDVASRLFKRNLPAVFASELVGYRPVITFVTLAEMTKWTELHSWGPYRREQLDRWLQPMAVLPATPQVARTWGVISAAADKRGRPRPQNDTWIAACCLTYEVPIATLNTKDFIDFTEHEGLVMLGQASH